MFEAVELRLLATTLTIAAFGRNSKWLFEVFPPGATSSATLHPSQSMKLEHLLGAQKGVGTCLALSIKI
ncbi:MAG: hypothetical protein WBE38_05745 [Terracidiphilus sp.]